MLASSGQSFAASDIIRFLSIVLYVGKTIIVYYFPNSPETFTNPMNMLFYKIREPTSSFTQMLELVKITAHSRTHPPIYPHQKIEIKKVDYQSKSGAQILVFWWNNIWEESKLDPTGVLSLFLFGDKEILPQLFYVPKRTMKTRTNQVMSF